MKTNYDNNKFDDYGNVIEWEDGSAACDDNESSQAGEGVKFLENLTPHVINICGVKIQPCGQVARVVMEKSAAGHAAGFPVTNNTVTGIENLPAQSPGMGYIVSGMVLAALNGTRSDVFAPDTGDTASRNDAGQIVSVNGLVQ